MAFKLWEKVIKSKKTSLIQTLYHYDQKNMAKSYWAKHVRSTLLTYQLNKNWTTQTTQSYTGQMGSWAPEVGQG